MSILFTISADGTADAVLQPILKWTLDQFHQVIYFDDFHILGKPKGELRDRLKGSVGRFPCDVLVVPRDAEGDEPETREREIQEAVATLAAGFRAVMGSARS